MAQRAPKTNGRPGHRTLIKEMANTYARHVIAEARGGATPERMHAAIRIINTPDYAARIRTIADIAVNRDVPLENRVTSVRKRLRALTVSVLQEHEPHYKLPEGSDDTFAKELTELLERTDEDTIFKKILEHARMMIAKRLTPLLADLDDGPNPQDVISSLMPKVHTGVVKIRHRDTQIAHGIDFIHMHIGWMLRDQGVPETVIVNLLGMLDGLDSILQQHYPDMGE